MSQRLPETISFENQKRKNRLPLDIVNNCQHRGFSTLMTFETLKNFSNFKTKEEAFTTKIPGHWSLSALAMGTMICVSRIFHSNDI